MITCKQDIIDYFNKRNLHRSAYELNKVLSLSDAAVSVLDEQLVVYWYDKSIPKPAYPPTKSFKFIDYIWDNFNGDINKINMFMQKFRLSIA